MFNDTKPFEIDKSKSRKGVSMSEALALLHCNSGLLDYTFKAMLAYKVV